MNRRHRLTSSTEFRRVRREGKSYAHPLSILVTCANGRTTSRFGITANGIVSSAMDDTFLSGLMPADSPEAEKRRKAMMRAYPLAKSRGSLGTTQDMANAVAFIASERASWITGQLLSVNGGYCMVD